MANINITGQFLNKDKREHEAIVVTVPAVIVPTSGRTNAAPQYIQANDTLTASVVPESSVLGKSYLIIEEAFPTGTTITVTGYGATLFNAVVGTATGITISTAVDKLSTTGGDVVVSILNGTAGNILTGKVKVVLDTIPYNVKNGRYSVKPV
jgi:hypothetical protein